MKLRWLVLISSLATSFPALAQHRGTSAGASVALLAGLIVVVFLALALSAVQKSFRSFFPTLAGLALMFILSMGGASFAQSFGLIEQDYVLWLAGGLFVAFLLGPAIHQVWRHRRGSDA
jgi:hypothetical protein